MGRWLAGRLMKELGLVSCQQPTYRYKRGGHEHVAIPMKWFTEFGHLNRGDMLTSEQHRCHNEKKKFQRRV